MRFKLLLLLLTVASAGPVQAIEWSGPVGPNATIWLRLDKGVLALTFEERWTEQPRQATALGSYRFDGELLELEIREVSFDGYGKESRRPEEGFVIETPRKGVMDDPVPSVTLRPGAYLRLSAVEDDSRLELRGNGGFELNLFR
jgi:hypothetical protein